MLYVQCQLQRGNAQKTAWIPQIFAHRGKVLKIKDEDGWVVIGCGAKMKEAEALERSRDYRLLPSILESSRLKRHD